MLIIPLCYYEEYTVSMLARRIAEEELVMLEEAKPVVAPEGGSFFMRAKIMEGRQETRQSSYSLGEEWVILKAKIISLLCIVSDQGAISRAL